MKFETVKSSYNTIISLGSFCQITYQLERKKLKNFSGPIDWMLSSSLTSVNRLLENKFKDFMAYHNLTVEGAANVDTYIVKDNLYSIESYHDFPITSDGRDPLHNYSIFKNKLDIRINNFFKKCTSCDSLLFIRMEAFPYEVIKLNSILKRIVKKNYTILVVNFSPNQKVIEQNWGIPNVCNVEIPNTLSTRWQGCDSSWDQILTGVSLQI
ncbi:DUF1796 family putative cysteine peptidase [Priestia megaterium]|uniref:DUF1796 family putative cysteine peptidase n=1 Tax=Priestia megaterium TaxID=1404 RepID=UPI00207970C2|nr:DUF1796 family putative cysteine peptidase [Priestia megaterium]USL44413.1 papain-like cysteine peptidase [Priestia megaterium]